ncbi:hypothetical protein STANM309S_06393 [Streptomyces tanashiensis]
MVEELDGVHADDRGAVPLLPLAERAADVRGEGSMPASPRVARTYETSLPSSVQAATAAAQPYSRSSGWATTASAHVPVAGHLRKVRGIRVDHDRRIRVASDTVGRNATREDHRAGDVPRTVGVEAAPVREGDREPLGADQGRDRVDRVGGEQGAGGLHFLAETGGGGTEAADQARPVADADRAVAVLHRRVRLRPGAGHFAQLERRLVGEADGPAGAEEGELAAPLPGGGQLLVQDEFRVGDRGAEVQPEPGAQELQGGGGEPGLDDGAFVGEAEVDDPLGEPPGRAVGDAGDDERRDAAAARASRSTTSVVVPERVRATIRSYPRPSGVASEAGNASVPPAPRDSRRAA